MLKPIFVALALLAATPAVAMEETDIVSVANDDPALLAAIEKARETLPGFWKRLARPGPGEVDFAIKLGITDGADTEHFWCTDIEGNSRGATCTIANTPVYVHTVEYGERVKVDFDIISDWIYYRDDKIVGGETIRAILPHLGKKEAARLSAQFEQP